MAQVCVTEHRGNAQAKFSAAQTKLGIGSLPSNPVPAWKYHFAASFTDAMGLSWGPNQAQKGNYEVCLKKSFSSSRWKEGGLGTVEDKKGNTAFVLAKQHNLKPFIKVRPKYHSIKLHRTELLQFLHIVNEQTI